MIGNSPEFVRCLNKIYTKPANIQKAKTKLEDDSVIVAGREVLRIADKFGKGWLALLVAEQLTYDTLIPEYILEAIAFASSHINTSSKAKAVRYRITMMKHNVHDESNEEAMKFRFGTKTDEQIVQDFQNAFPNDELSDFLNFL